MLSALALVAALATAQCATGITDNAQNLCGTKTLPNGAVVGQNSGDYEGLVVRGGGVWLDGPYSFVQTPPGSGRAVLLRSDVLADAAGGSFIFEQWRVRSPGDPVVVVKRLLSNGLTDEIYRLLNNGTVVAASFKTTAQHSGYPTFQAEKNYVGVSADFPANYQGEHGALSVSATNPCIGYNLIQAGNGRSDAGARTDYAFNVSCRGGIYSRDLLNSTELPVCNGALNEPPEPNNRYVGCAPLANPSAPLCNFGACGVLVDGGYCYDWTTMYGPPSAKAGETFGFVADVGEGCQCVPAAYDGGASPAGWFKLSDRSECRP
ncbi:MAG: hypothetical protein KA310_03500 [Pseudomonadales bacterium]|nr:hypothetical protein [Pseudomonadales bacterium]